MRNKLRERDIQERRDKQRDTVKKSLKKIDKKGIKLREIHSVTKKGKKKEDRKHSNTKSLKKFSQNRYILFFADQIL